MADFYRDYRQDEIYRDPLVVKVIQYFWANLCEEITLATLLKKFSVNKNILNDAFNKEVGMPCMSYLENLRMTNARIELQQSDRTISAGVFPQVIEKNVTYIQKEKDGPWEVESSSETKWELGDSSEIPDSYWRFVVDDCASISPALEEDFKGWIPIKTETSSHTEDSTETSRCGNYHIEKQYERKRG